MQKGLCVVVLGAALALAACGKDPGPKGDAGAQGPAPGRKAPKASRVHPGRKGSKVPKDLRDLKVLKVPVPAGPKGDAGQSGATVRAVQADGTVACDANETLVSVFCPAGGAPDGAKCGTPPVMGLCLKNP